MNEEELLKKITAVVVEKLGVKAEDVSLDSAFVNDLGADSLDRVELVMALEDEFDIEILDEDAEKFIKVSDVLAYVQNKLNA
ncbi:MAG: acyl carrier protein [Fibrobacteraceae bacterium]|nr:MAG: acyl carrier protein [Fibrobacteres bacterium CG2_30_45_31]